MRRGLGEGGGHPSTASDGSLRFMSGCSRSNFPHFRPVCLGDPDPPLDPRVVSANREARRARADQVCASRCGFRTRIATPMSVPPWRSPAEAGLLVSRPVSRILSCAAICLAGAFASAGLAPCPLPGARRAGSSLLLGVAPDGVWPAAASPRRWCALTAPFHPCLCAPHVLKRHRRSVSVPLSRGFRRVGITDRPCPSVSGLSSRVASRGRTAYASDCTPESALQPGSAAQRSHSAQLGPAALARGAGRHRAAADGTGAAPFDDQVLPGAEDSVLQREPVIEEARTRLCPLRPLGGGCRLACGDGAHSATFLNTPTTRPRSWASRVRIGL
jgi:hypothetical protein